MPIQLRDTEGDAELLRVVRQNLTRPPLLVRIPDFTEPDRVLRLGREGGAVAGARGVPGAPGAAGGPSLGDCLIGGSDYGFASPVPAATDEVHVSPKISDSFIVNHIGYFSSSTITTGIAITVKVSQDNDSSGGNFTSGVNVITGPGIPSVTPAVGFAQIFPGKRFDLRNLFLKIVFRNTTGGTVTMACHVGLIFI